jgi:hypothetical protein
MWISGSEPMSVMSSLNIPVVSKYSWIKRHMQLLLTITQVSNIYIPLCLLVWWCLTQLSTIFQLYHDGQLCWRKQKDPEETTDKLFLLSHNVVHLALIEIPTHNITGDMDYIGSCKFSESTIRTTRQCSARFVIFTHIRKFMKEQKKS